MHKTNTFCFFETLFLISFRLVIKEFFAVSTNLGIAPDDFIELKVAINVFEGTNTLYF